MSVSVQVLGIHNLNSALQMDDDDYLIIYDAANATYKRIQKTNIQFDMVVHGDSNHNVTYLKADNDLSDVSDLPTTLSNLGLSDVLKVNNNLSDVQSISTTVDNLGLSNVKKYGGYIEITEDTLLSPYNKYVIRSNVTVTLPLSPSAYYEIEIIAGSLFGDSDVLDSFIDPNGSLFEGSSDIITMSFESMIIVYVGGNVGWIRK